jgi:hypothetical protein
MFFFSLHSTVEKTRHWKSTTPRRLIHSLNSSLEERNKDETTRKKNKRARPYGYKTKWLTSKARVPYRKKKKKKKENTKKRRTSEG